MLRTASTALLTANVFPTPGGPVSNTPRGMRNSSDVSPARTFSIPIARSKRNLLLIAHEGENAIANATTLPVNERIRRNAALSDECPKRTASIAPPRALSARSFKAHAVKRRRKRPCHIGEVFLQQERERSLGVQRPGQATPREGGGGRHSVLTVPSRPRCGHG